jgi:uncharacterized protein (TIGR04222 family)
MNPLDWTGPEFLQFYIPYGLCILALAWWARAFVLRSPAGPDGHWLPGSYPRDREAPLIAHLRGGSRETVQTLLCHLIGLGLLELTGRQVRVLPASPGTPPLQPIEEAAWKALDTGEPLSVLEAEARVYHAVIPHLQEMERMLTEEGLLTTPGQAARLLRLRIVAWIAVSGLGLVKLVVALSRGRMNVFYLGCLLILFSVVILVMLRPPRRLPAADQYLSWLQEAYRGLAQRLESDRRDPRDFSFAAGIYGLAAIPALVPLGMAFQPVPPQRRQQDSGGGCGGGSSCSSGSGGGGDSGGGGGDGGGGGGGCGGCGGD